MLCDNCKMETDAIYVDDSTLYTMQYIVSAELRKLYTFMVSEEVLDRLEMVLNRCFAAQTSHQFQSLDILKTIAGWTKSYGLHSTRTLAAWVRKNVIRAFAGFFYEAKLKISLQLEIVRGT